MSRTLRISRARKQDYADIEDVDALLADLEEKAVEDVHLDPVPEESPADIVFEDGEPDTNGTNVSKPFKAPKKSIPVKIGAKGKRTIHIQELDPNIIPPNLEEFMDPNHTGSKIAVIGKPGTGKSSLIRSLLYEKSEIFPCGQIYSGTEDSNHAYGRFMPSTFIHNSFNQSAYMDFIRRQKIAKQYLENPWSVCVWDDITEDERIFNLPLVKGTYKNGRHWKMLHLLSLQYALDIKPVIRTNIDGAFLLRETNKRNRKVLFENYASAIDDYSDFCSIFDQVTNDYTSLYIHNRVQSNSFEDCVFWYKARDDIPQDFTFGCKEYWMFHEERYNPLYVDPITV
jgi:hypothetical protein